MKRILFLENSSLATWLQNQGENITQTTDKLSFKTVVNFDFLISYGYRHILSKDILNMFPNRAINLHISYLPWNRGADPNFWSFIEDTPKGVTIHYLDEGIDTGDIIVQKRIEFGFNQETLSTSYKKLQTTVQELFKQNWLNIKAGKCRRYKQNGKGSSHNAKDKENLSHLLINGWDTPVSILDEYAAEIQMSKQFWDKYDCEL